MRKFMFRQTSDDQETPKSSMAFRINIFFFSTFAIFCVIIIRLAILQFVESTTLTEKEASMNYKDIPLPPDRGSIRDVTGIKLAYSKPVWSLYITLMKDYSLETDKGKANRPEAIQMANKMAEVFREYGNKDDKPMTADEILKAMDLDFKLSLGFTPRRIKIDLSKGEITYFTEHKADFPGIDLVEEGIRQYDKDTVAVQTVGYINAFKKTQGLPTYQKIREENKTQKDPGQIYIDEEFVGVDGIEFSFQDELRGKNGYKEVSVSSGNLSDGIIDVVPPVKGNDVWLTINKQVQLKTEQAIVDQLNWLHTNPVSGSTHPEAVTGYAVAMEVDTGNIVAMASIPDYDANVWQSGGISPDNYDKIKNYYQNGTITSFSSGRSGHGLDSEVLLGSTIKPLSVLIGLQEGLFTTSTSYTDKGITYVGKEQKPVRNTQSHAYGYFSSPAKAIEHSSNVFMVDMVGKKLYEKYGKKGIGVWDKYMEDFGLGVLTGVDLPKEHPGLKDYTNIKQMGSEQASLVYSSFGQGGKYTTLQLAQYVTTLANKGVRIKPQIVSKITDQNGKVVKTFKREELEKFQFKPAYWNEIIQGMNTKVEAFNGFPYDFARKTGTSQQDAAGKTRDNGVFIAFAPRKNPKLAVAVIIPEGGFGSNSAAPVARKIFDAYDEVYGLDGVPKKATGEQTTDDPSDKTNQSQP